MTPSTKIASDAIFQIFLRAASRKARHLPSGALIGALVLAWSTLFAVLVLAGSDSDLGA